MSVGQRTVTFKADQLLMIPEDGALVICGPARAVWEVWGHQLLSGDRVAITLAPVDQHQVPLDRWLLELPMPSGTHGEA